MAENNHIEASATVAGQKLGFVSKDVVTILLLVIVAGLAVLLWAQSDKRSEIFQNQHMLVFELMKEQNKQRRADMQQIFQWAETLQYNCARSPDGQIPLSIDPRLAPKADD